MHLLELGAGDGSLALSLGKRLAVRWPAAELTLLDRQALIAPATGIAFAHLDWILRPLTVDALEWARAPQSTHWDIIFANLFLHHFEEARLRELLSAIAARCELFIACEPRRSLPALLGARLLPALGVSRETRHDALVSAQAGFRGGELSRLWPPARSGWRLEEDSRGLFSHLFVAVRDPAAS
ncbi:MAG: methyltransferase domain-containing protein [Steroidobacteraceae bacterium]